MTTVIRTARKEAPLSEEDDKDAPAPRPWDLDQYRTDRVDRPPPVPFSRERRRATGEMDEDEAFIARSLEPGAIRARYRDDGSLFVETLKMALLTVVTLGLYRFWMVTRLRRYYANAIRLDGDPFEYTGKGLEKLLGFLLALIVLAVYLGLVNLILTFAGLSYFDGHPLALNVTIIATLPFYFWATYRARRYVLSRLRWRGIRFGAEPGAWGYTLRSLALTVLTVLTAGLALPYQHFKQAQFMTDRSWFGDLPFRQGGSWLGLMYYWIWMYISAAACALLTWGMVIEADYDPAFTQGAVVSMSIIWVMIAGVIFFVYQVGSFRYLWDTRMLGDAPFGNDVSPRRVFFVYLGGYLAVSGLTMVGAAIVAAILAAIWMLAGGPSLDALGPVVEGTEPPAGDEADVLAKVRLVGPLAVVVVFGYLIVFAISYALTQVFLIQPVLRRKVEGMTMKSPEVLREAAQRDHDKATEAGGFADALGVDVGAGF